MNKITITDNGMDEIIIRLTGEAVANLRKAAETMNALEWCGSDNTAESILHGFALFPLEYWGEAAPHYEGLCLFEQLNNLVEGIDTDAEDDDEDEARKAELRDALYRAFDIRDIAELKGANDGTHA